MKQVHISQQEKELPPTVFINNSGVKYTEQHLHRHRRTRPRDTIILPTTPKQELTAQSHGDYNISEYAP